MEMNGEKFRGPEKTLSLLTKVPSLRDPLSGGATEFLQFFSDR